MSCKRYWGPKDPNEVMDYTIDWKDVEYPVLEAAETIATSDVTLVTGTVVIDSDTDDGDGLVTVWLSGGTEGETAEVLNRIVTSLGRTYDQTVYLKIRSR